MNPKLIVVAGPNGAGKTTITEKLLRHEWMDDCVYINPDIIAQEKFGGWNSQEAIIKAANHSQKMFHRFRSFRRLSFDTTHHRFHQVHVKIRITGFQMFGRTGVIF